MPWDRKRLLGYVETIQLILGVTDNTEYMSVIDLDFLSETQFALYLWIAIYHILESDKILRSSM